MERLQITAVSAKPTHYISMKILFLGAKIEKSGIKNTYKKNS
jgi:hypothetical protein